MTIYTRHFGLPVKLTRPITTEREVERIEGRDADEHDRRRLSYGMYAAGKIEGDDTERMFDLGMLRADGGISEINTAARAVGCNPK